MIIEGDPTHVAPRTIPSSAPISVGPTEGSQTRQQSIVEAWAQGFHVGAILMLLLITLCNYRRRVVLHKLILLELFLALWHGTFIFFSDPVYGWYLSGTAVPLYVSYTLHNVVSWMKIKPFLPKWGGKFFIISLSVVQPYWILEAWANFAYFNNLNPGSRVFETSRYLEAAARDPWWIFTTVMLCVVISRNYELSFISLVRASPRFGVMMACMFVSIIFLITDIIVTAKVSKQSGINPYWRLALVFKCASDTIFLDDFKSVLDRIVRSAMKHVARLPYTTDHEGEVSHVSRVRVNSLAVHGGRSSTASPNNRRPSTASAARKSSFAEHEKKSWRQNRIDSYLWRKEKHSSDGESSTTAMGAVDENAPHQNYGHSYSVSAGPFPKHGRSLSKTRSIDQNSSHEHILHKKNSRESPPAVVADYEWAMAQEEYERNKDFERDIETGIPMMPMKAQRSNSRVYM